MSKVAAPEQSPMLQPHDMKDKPELVQLYLSNVLQHLSASSSCAVGGVDSPPDMILMIRGMSELIHLFEKLFLRESIQRPIVKMRHALNFPKPKPKAVRQGGPASHLIQTLQAYKQQNTTIDTTLLCTVASKIEIRN